MRLPYGVGVPLGISTLFLVVQKKPFSSVLSLISDPIAEEAGYLEIVDNASTKLTDGITKSLARLNETGYSFTVHSPYEDVNIASSDLSVRRRSIDAVKTSLRRAVEFEALNVVVHPGTRDSGATVDEAFQANCDSILEIWDYSCSLGQHMSVENDIPHHGGLLVLPDDFRRFFSLGGVRMPLLLDVGHANMSKSLRAFIEQMSSDFAELHVHDNNGLEDQHLAMGGGNVDFGLLKPLFANSSLLFTVESVHDPIESFKKLVTLRKQALLF